MIKIRDKNFCLPIRNGYNLHNCYSIFLPGLSRKDQKLHVGPHGNLPAKVDIMWLSHESFSREVSAGEFFNKNGLALSNTQKGAIGKLSVGTLMLLLFCEEGFKYRPHVFCHPLLSLCCRVDTVCLVQPGFTAHPFE